MTYSYHPIAQIIKKVPAQKYNTPQRNHTLCLCSMSISFGAHFAGTSVGFKTVPTLTGWYMWLDVVVALWEEEEPLREESKVGERVGVGEGVVRRVVWKEEEMSVAGGVSVGACRAMRVW